MKNYISFLFVLMMLSSCSIAMYSVNNRKIDVVKKESYEVIYKAKLAKDLTADITYVDADEKKVHLKAVTGSWEKHVVLQTGTKASLEVNTKAEQARAEMEVVVSGKVISEYTLKGKKLHYYFGFNLP